MDVGIEVRNQVIFYDFPANADRHRFADPKQLELAIKKVKSETVSLKPIQDAEWFDVTLGTNLPQKTSRKPKSSPIATWARLLNSTLTPIMPVSSLDPQSHA